METPEREFKGIWIPKEIWESTNLTAIEKVVFAELDSLDGDEGCYATNEYLADFCKCSVPTITRTIAKLKSLGYITSVSGDGRRRIIKMIRQTNHDDDADSSNGLGRVITVISRENNILNNRLNNIDIPPISPTGEQSDDTVFEGFWAAYPKKVGKQKAMKAWKAAMKSKTDVHDIAKGLDEWKRYWAMQKTDIQYIPYPSSWLNARSWEDAPKLQSAEEKFNEMEFDF